MNALGDDVCTGDQALVGRCHAVADAGPALVRLARVVDGQALRQESPERDAVVVLQRALVALGFPTCRAIGFADGSAIVDGVFGPGTERGVAMLQREAGVESTGVVDASTLLALDDAVSARLAAMDADERRRQRDVLDRTIRIDAAELKRRYHPAIVDAAAAAEVKEEVIAAVMVVESGGGANNRPKFEAHHLAALADMHDVVAGIDVERADAARVATLAHQMSTLTIRAGENGESTPLSRHLVGWIAADTRTEAVRGAVRIIRDWTRADMRQLATSWGWGQIMGWHTLSPAYARRGVTLATLQSQSPARQIAGLGAAISIEPTWRVAAQRACGSGDYSHFAEAYNGSPRGFEKNTQYTAALRDAAAAYRVAP